MFRFLVPALAAAFLFVSAKPAQAQVYYSPGYVYPAGYSGYYSPYYGGSGVSVGLGGVQVNFGTGSGYYGHSPYYGYQSGYYTPYYGSSWNRGYTSYGGNRGWGGGRRGWRR